MVHHVCPAYVDEKGLQKVHTKEFKAMEQQFEYYDLAQRWIKDHQPTLSRFLRGQMAGHSKWANIKHRKGKADAKKGKIFSRFAKEIISAVKVGGSPDPKIILVYA